MRRAGGKEPQSTPYRAEEGSVRRIAAQPIYEIAAAYVALHDHDRAIALLSAWLDRSRPGPNFMAVDPLFDGLRADGRWTELVRRVNMRSGVSPRVVGRGETHEEGLLHFGAWQHAQGLGP